MKQFKYIQNFAVCWLCLMVSFSQINAQTPCEEGGYALSTTSSPPLCYNGNTGTATVASTGCDCMFSGCTFLWPDGQTAHTAVYLSPGEYNVIVTHPDSCVMEISVIVEQPEPFIQDIIVSPILCRGEANGSITILPTPENFNQLTYEWSNGSQSASIQNLSPGEYSVTITDFGDCQIVESFVIEEAPTEKLECVFETKPSCEEQSTGEIEVFAVGGQPPYLFRLANQPFQAQAKFDNLASGAYDIIMKDDNDCTTSIIIQVDSEGFADPVVSSEELQLCKGESTNIEANSANTDVSYHWSPEAGVSNPNSNSIVVNPEVTTTYTVTVSNQQNCQKSVSLTIEVDECQEEATGLSSIESTGIQLFPNPVVDLLNVQLPDFTNYQLSVYDLSGKKIIEKELNASQQLSFENFAKGIYILTLESEEGQFFAKIVKD